jgi:hypothetical protein
MWAISVVKETLNRLVGIWAEVQRRLGWFGDVWPYSLLVLALGSPALLGNSMILGHFIQESIGLRWLFLGTGVSCGIITGISVLLDRTLIALTES